MRYLAEKDGRQRLLPADFEERALVEQWLQWQATELNPQWGYAVYALLRKAPGFDDPEKVEQSLEQVGAKMRMLEDAARGDRRLSPAARPSASPTSRSGCRSTAGTQFLPSCRSFRPSGGTTMRCESAPGRRALHERRMSSEEARSGCRGRW